MTRFNVVIDKVRFTRKIPKAILAEIRDQISRLFETRRKGSKVEGYIIRDNGVYSAVLEVRFDRTRNRRTPINVLISLNRVLRRIGTHIVRIRHEIIEARILARPIVFPSSRLLLS